MESEKYNEPTKINSGFLIFLVVCATTVLNFEIVGYIDFSQRETKAQKICNNNVRSIQNEILICKDLSVWEWKENFVNVKK